MSDKNTWHLTELIYKLYDDLYKLYDRAIPLSVTNESNKGYNVFYIFLVFRNFQNFKWSQIRR